MKSQTATQILYDDPNSFFRASKAVALTEKTGASLKTIKPKFEDTKQALATSSRVMQFINELDGIDTRMKYITQNMVNMPQYTPFIIGTIENSSREILKYIGMAEASMRALKNSTTISQEDLQQIYALLMSISESDDAIRHDAEIGEIDDAILESTTFAKMMSGLSKMYTSIITFINLKQTGQNNLVQTQTPAAEAFDEIPPPEEELVEEPYVGAGRRSVGASSGHFKVLSERARQIQAQPYKRFI
jgi:hypothetical protein